MIRSAPELRARDLAKRARLEELVQDHLAERASAVDPGRLRAWVAVTFAVFFAAMESWIDLGGRLGDRVAEAFDAGGELYGVPVTAR